MRNWLRKALTKTVWIETGASRKVRMREVPPSERLVLAMCFAIAALIALSVLEALHIVFLGSFNDAIFNAINGLVGTIIGIIIGRKV